MVYKARYCQITTLRSKENLKSYLDKNKDSIFIGALMNIDDFSSVNEIYGGEVGNTLLKIFAKRLSRLELNDYYLYRLNADNFIFTK